MEVVKNKHGEGSDKEILTDLKNINEHRKTSHIIFTNRRLRRFFRMFVEHIVSLLEKNNELKKDKTPTG